jgi:hypothetical protein
MESHGKPGTLTSQKWWPESPERGASSGKVCVSVEVEVVPAGVNICRAGSIEEGDACRIRTCQQECNSAALMHVSNSLSSPM